MSNKYLNDEHLQTLCDRSRYLDVMIETAKQRMKSTRFCAGATKILIRKMELEHEQLGIEIYLLNSYLTE